jgi:endoglucanase
MSLAQTVLPRWRGFNLLEMFTTKSDGDFREEDYRWISDWGFDFVRLPMCYTLWTQDDDPYRIDEGVLEKVDRAITLGQAHGLHVSLNFHRAPGYSVNREREEPFDLWHDEEALDAFCFHWQLFAKRYRGIPSDMLSFDLVNEPPAPAPDGMTRRDHEHVVRTAVAAIREADPERLIIMDGLSWGNDPCPELVDLHIAQSCRAYAPMGVSHYKASWVASEGWPAPIWPGAIQGDEVWDVVRLEEHYAQWIALARGHTGVHCGEGGAHNRTPHPVVLAWLRDVLDILKTAGIGFALWNFRGSFGIMDSGRDDVDYEDFEGHKLDRKLLKLLQDF